MGQGAGETDETGEGTLFHERVRLRVRDHVAEVALARPDKLNCLDLPMFRGIVAAGEAVAGTPGVRAVVLHGEGRSFCSGLDFMGLMAGGPEAQEELLAERRGIANLAQRVAWVWQELRVPVIAALQGHVFGGGLQIAAGADIRLAHPEARLSVMEIKWGLIPDMGITRTLASFLRPDVLRELTWTGREVSGEEALSLGLVTRLASDPLAEARALARAIAGRSPHAVQAAKALLARAPALDDAEAFRLESELQRGILASPNQVEAAMASMQRRPPVFADPALPEEAG